MQGLLRWTVRVLCVGLACLLVFLLVRYQKTERAQDAHIAQLRKQAETYEARLKEIQRELDAAKASIGSENRSGMILLAFQIGSAEDLARLDERPTVYGFTPVIVLDALAPDVGALADLAARSDYAVVYTAAPFAEEAAAQAAALLPEPDGEEAQTPAPKLFLLREAYETEENLALLADAGFDGCICYYDHAAFAAAHPDFSLMQYSFLRDENIAVDKRLQTLSDGGEVLAFVFDLSAEEMTPEALDRYLTAICTYAADHNLQITTTEQICLAIQENRTNTAAGQAAYDRLAAERQPEIDALRAKLDEIYSNWKGESAA